MEILLESAGKRFNYEWIFKNLQYHFQHNKSYAITGPNGSGKSTLLQIIAGSMNLSEGKISYQLSNISDKKSESQFLSGNNIYKHISIVAPYFDIIEEMTAIEFFAFHQKFKPFITSVSILQILEMLEIKESAKKQIRFYSSGMKQRIKLAQAIFSDVPVLLLDEPCTNFDKSGYTLYYHLINRYCKNRLVIVSSNDEKEYIFCEDVLAMQNYKK